MLGNCENMVIISSTSNEWPQDQLDEKSLMASTSKLMEKTGHQELTQAQQQQQQPPLKCPRCDSSNTKFCYYNNYSLSQPRHFCKACKRYWTRGGTLRNVPVGGGCRKNKRVKRPSSSMEGANSSSVSSANPNPTSQSQLDISSTSNHISPLFYGLSNPSEMNLPFPGRFSSRVSSNMESTISGYPDLQPQLNALALGFSTSGMVSGSTDTNGFHKIQDVVSSNSLLSSYCNLFGSSSSTTATTSPTISTLLASNLQQQQKYNNNNGSIKEARVLDHFQNLTPFGDLQMGGNCESAGIALKGVKIEQGQNRVAWNAPCLNQMEQIGFSDPSAYWTTATGVGAWHDPANMGSSVTSLI
ncbi:hypothetical protein Tsubulata_044363 [Turnera subulata]|uniref:Dof zinc finger protein n=1 Tax=Turnera subulata TaxID=218843 RepID=A0A9Q0FUR1_9ROSI|nr:hypothetical protein Tsubulata_044363 [Turnera subulata]